MITRSDFDGLACAVLLKEINILDSIKFVHPNDMQTGSVVTFSTDITTNLPYVEGVHLAFDHHSSEVSRVVGHPENHIIDPDAPSAARVVYNYYGGKDKFPKILDTIMEAVDKGDSAQFSEDEILNPDGWALLDYLVDARSGLGRYRKFKVSSFHLMMELIDYCRDHTIEEILALPGAKERADLFREHQDQFTDQIKRCTRVHGDLAVFDLRREKTIFAGNRFMIYALYPEINISVHVLFGLNKLKTVFATGKSIVNRTSNVDIGELMLKHGGGGHKNAGTCQVENADADHFLGELIEQIAAAG